MKKPFKVYIMNEKFENETFIFCLVSTTNPFALNYTSKKILDKMQNLR